MYDAIVVGAGCAGSAIALQLAQQDHKVLLLDVNKFPETENPATNLIHQRGIACLERWGLREAIAKLAPPINKYKLKFGDQVLDGVAPAVDGEQYAFALRNSTIDEILRGAAIDSGVEFREGARVDRVLKEDGRAIGVNGATEGRNRFNEHAHVVIGADGAASRLAIEVAAAESRVEPAVQVASWTYWNDMSLDGVELYVNDSRAIYAFPSTNGSTLIGANWTFDSFAEAHKDLEANYHASMRELAPELAALAADSYRADEALHRGAARNYYRQAAGPGWALIGDAYHLQDPCTAQGVTNAFCDAELLAAAIDKGLGGGPEGLDAALEAFATSSLERTLPYHEMTLKMARFAPTAEQLALYGALEGSADDISAFIGTLSQAVSPEDFFDAANVERIIQRATA